MSRHNHFLDWSAWRPYRLLQFFLVLQTEGTYGRAATLQFSEMVQFLVVWSMNQLISASFIWFGLPSIDPSRVDSNFPQSSLRTWVNSDMFRNSLCRLVNSNSCIAGFNADGWMLLNSKYCWASDPAWGTFPVVPLSPARSASSRLRSDFAALTWGTTLTFILNWEMFGLRSNFAQTGVFASNWSR